MNFPTAFISFAFLFASSEAFFYQWRSTSNMQRRKESQKSCPLSTLIQKTNELDFRVTLMCNETFIPLRQTRSQRFMNKREKHGTRCTYTYACDYDSPSVLRYSTMQCNRGKWNGTVPVCQNIVTDEIMRVMGQMPKRDSTPPQNSDVEESSEGSSSSSSSASASSSVRKSSSKYARFREICDTQQMCSRLRNINDCKYVVPKSISAKMSAGHRKFFDTLCRTCFTLFCRGSVILL